MFHPVCLRPKSMPYLGWLFNPCPMSFQVYAHMHGLWARILQPSWAWHGLWHENTTLTCPGGQAWIPAADFSESPRCHMCTGIIMIIQQLHYCVLCQCEVSGHVPTSCLQQMSSIDRVISYGSSTVTYGYNTVYACNIRLAACCLARDGDSSSFSSCLSFQF